MANRFKEKEAKVMAQVQAQAPVQVQAEKPEVVEAPVVVEHSLVTAGKLEKTDTVDDLVVATEKVEARSKRLNLLVKPSVHAAALKKCQKLGISINESINQILEKWVAE